jgi:hypothetical protein
MALPSPTLDWLKMAEGARHGLSQQFDSSRVFAERNALLLLLYHLLRVEIIDLR